MCDIITKYMNPSLTVFGDENASNSNKMKSNIYSKHSYEILILNPPQVHSIHEIQEILNQFETYVGVVKNHKYIKFNNNDDCYAITVKFDYWYDTMFTQKLHSELIIANEFSKISCCGVHSINVKIHDYVYKIILYKTHTNNKYKR